MSMRASWVIAVAVTTLMLASAVDAQAQPGRSTPAPPVAPAYDASHQPAQQTYRLTHAESKLLRKGFYSDTQIVGGGLIGTFFGFGLGQAVQSRWEEKGWVFTFGQAAGMGILVYGVIDCAEAGYNDDYERDSCSVGSLIVGALTYGVFRIWELIDVWSAPAMHNTKLRNLRYRLGMDRPQYQRWGFYAVPSRKGSGGVAGLRLRF